MRVVHVHRVSGVGGSERHLLTLLPALRARGVDARFLGLDDGDPDPFYAQLDALGVPTTASARRATSIRCSSSACARLLRRLRPDIVHTHLVHADVYGGLASLAADSTLVSTKHNDDPFRRGPFRHVERLLARRAARIICITDALARFNVREVGLPEAKLIVVHYGLDELPAAGGRPGSGMLPEDAPLLLAISRLERQKGLDVAIEALARIRAAGSPATLLILGGGSLEAELQALAAGARRRRRRRSSPGRTGDVAALARAGRRLRSPGPLGGLRARRCSRRCSRGSRSWRARSARSPRSSSTARPATSCPRTTSSGSPTRRPPCWRTRAARLVRRGRARAGAHAVLGRADGRGNARGLRRGLRRAADRARGA